MTTSITPTRSQTFARLPRPRELQWASWHTGQKRKAAHAATALTRKGLGADSGGDSEQVKVCIADTCVAMSWTPMPQSPMGVAKSTPVMLRDISLVKPSPEV